MFDPTIFENLKVAFENHVYDLDNVTGEITITNRIDRLELSTMSREFALQFTLSDQKQNEVTAEIVLEVSLKDLAAEILEVPDQHPGCTLIVRFHMRIENVSTQCKQIEDVLQDIWKPAFPLVQTLSFVYNQEQVIYMDTVEIKFNHKINEEQMGQIHDFIDHVLQTLQELNTICVLLINGHYYLCA